MADPIHEKNFMNGIQNARRILENLERSIKKTEKYETQLLQCKTKHAHAHSAAEWWAQDITVEKESNLSKAGATKTPRSQVDLAESWSTMSIVCLQYQYEELTKRYESLLRAYDERSSALNAREDALSRLQKQASSAQKQLAQTHKALLLIGDKYIELQKKRHEQKSTFEERIRRLKESLRRKLVVAENARLDVDAELTRKMAVEQDGSSAMLLSEIRKCNRLCLENMRLKIKIEELLSSNNERGSINCD